MWRHYKPYGHKMCQKILVTRKLNSGVEKGTRILASRRLISSKNRVAVSKVRLSHEPGFISRLLFLVLLMSYSWLPYGLHPLAFSRQEYCSSCSLILQRIFPTQGCNPGLLAPALQADSYLQVDKLSEKPYLKVDAQKIRSQFFLMN